MKGNELPDVNPEHLYNLKKASPLLDDRTPDAIRKLIVRKRLAAQKGRDGAWRIKGSEIIAFNSGLPEAG